MRPTQRETFLPLLALKTRTGTTARTMPPLAAGGGPQQLTVSIEPQASVL